VTYPDEVRDEPRLRHPEHQMLAEVLQGLRQSPKRVHPKFFYDEYGSALFEEICEQPEYYIPDTEIALLHALKTEFIALAPQVDVLIEFGSGASKKVRTLLEDIRPKSYLGIDISRDFLEAATLQLAADYPWLDVSGVCADLCQPLTLPNLPTDNKLGFYPGSSIGNFEPADAIALLRNMAGVLGPGGSLLIGVDLKKDPAVLNRAYNDRAGVTERFNKNLLTRLNNELEANFKPDNFRHLAFYNAQLGRIEMHLESLVQQTVALGEVSFTLAEGERIHTESSHKYSLEEFQQLARRAGLNPRKSWTDQDKLFSLHWLQVNA
jgi:dimethylhistidine N-methyltransferase